MTTAIGVQPRRDRQREETRRELALAAFDLARDRGLANVRVPDIAAAVGVSTRTFNNYFASKEEAIAWPAAQRAAALATGLTQRPPDEALGEALVATITGRYGPAEADGLPPHWLRDFRALVAREPSLHGEYLKASDAAERALAAAIALRQKADAADMSARVLAAMVIGAERAAVMFWMANREGLLIDAVRSAVKQATAGVGESS